ncbi:MAG: hypothetical protein WD875_02135 [Pirellulales bacterium]
MRAYTTIAIVLLAIAAPDRVNAHEDYEDIATTLTRPNGEEFEVVRHWTDGIFFTDPVKLILRKKDGEVLAETEYRRNLVLARTSDDRWLAFTASTWNIFYHRAWWIESGELVPASDFAHIPTAFIAAIREHWLGYSTSVSLIVAAFAAFRGRNGRKKVWHRVSLAALICFAIPFGLIFVWKWIDVVRAGIGEHLFSTFALTAIAAMFAFFCVRVCRTSGSALSLATNLAIIWMLLLTLYGSALPLSILLAALFVSSALYLLIEKTSLAQVSPPSN